MSYLVTILLIFALLLTPVAVPVALVATLVLHRRYGSRVSSPVAIPVLTVLVTYGVLLSMVFFTPMGRVLGNERLQAWISLADGCGLVRGTSLWIQHGGEAQYGLCRFCDDTNWGSGYRPEYRRLYCP